MTKPVKAPRLLYNHALSHRNVMSDFVIKVRPFIMAISTSFSFIFRGYGIVNWATDAILGKVKLTHCLCD